MALEKLIYQRVEATHLQSPNGYIKRQQWTAPAAASATFYASAHNLDGSTVSSFSSQPVVPRNVQIVASGAATGNVVVNGTDMRGGVISETLALNGATPVLGNKAFASVTSIVLPTVGATTINVGTGVKLGLDRNLLESSVLDTYTDGVRDTTAATVASSGSMGDANISSNTIITNTAPNGTHNFAVYLATTEVTDTPYTTA